MEKSFLWKEAIRFAWEKTKSFFWLFFGVSFILYAVAGISSFSNNGEGKASAFSGLMSLASVIFSIIVQIGIVKITLKVADGGTPVFDDLFSEIRLFWKYLGATLIYSLIVIAGLCLLIVPGIIWGIKFQFYRYLILDKGMGIMDAIRKSAEITNGAKWDLFLFGLICVGITILGVLAFGIGVFVSAPVVMIANAFVYRKLLGRSAGSTMAIPAQ